MELSRVYIFIQVGKSLFLFDYKYRRIIIDPILDFYTHFLCPSFYLYTFVVKSLRAVSLQQATLDDKGFVGDRRFMVVYPVPLPVSGSFGPQDSTHRFLTQRQCPTLATGCATIWKNSLIVTFGDQAFALPLKPPSSIPQVKAGIWGDQVLVQDMGDKAAEFFQAIVSKDSECRTGDEGTEEVAMQMYQGVRLVYHSGEDRLANEKFVPAVAKTWLGYSPPVSLTDGFPILIACQASLDELNRQLKEQGKDVVPMSRFRPNIVIQGTKPFEEDMWKTVKIGARLFSIVKACPRCKQSCTDQETGKVSAEPVAIMKSFRALGENGDDVYFAQNALALSRGTVDVNAPVQVLERGDPVYC
jgi:uncharacterized protein YcbX